MTINTSTHPYSSELSPGLLGLPRASSHSSLSFKASLPSELPYEYVLCRFELCEFKIARAKIITKVSPSGSPLRQDANLPNTHTVPQDSRPSETYVYREEGVYLRAERGHVGAVGMGSQYTFSLPGAGRSGGP